MTFLGSIGDLTCYTCSETERNMHHPKKESLIACNGSFNLTDRGQRNYFHQERNWIESTDKKFNSDKLRLKLVDEYQSPSISKTSFEQDSMKAAFEMHLDRGIDQKKNTKGLRNLFGNKCPQKPNLSDLPYEPQKTLLGKL
jgi:hypothetical protein